MPKLLFSAVLAAAFGFAATAQAHVQLIRIEMGNDACTPDRLDLVAGSPVQFEFANTSDRDHDFAAPELFAAGTLTPEDRARVEDGLVEVDAGRTVELRFTPVRKGTYRIDCSGATGTAAVE